MRICRRCGKTTEIEGSFCENCGGAMTEVIFCPHCGASMPADAAFCPVCGKSKNDGTNENSTRVAAEETVAVEAPGQKPKSRKKWAIIGASIAALAVVIGAVALLSHGKASSKGESREELLYTSDGELYCLRGDKDDGVRIAKEVYINNGGSIIENGKTLLYSNGVTLYSLSLKDKGAKPKKISDLYAYSRTQLSADGTVAYLDDDRELFFGPYESPASIDEDVAWFQYDAKSGAVWYRTIDGDLFLMPKGYEAERVSKDVYGVAFASKDGKSILFGDDDGDVYIKKYGKDKEKLTTEASRLVVATDDLSAFYYLDENEALYVQKGKNEPKVICGSPSYCFEAIGSTIIFVNSEGLYFCDGENCEKIGEDSNRYTTLRTDDEFFIALYRNSGYLIVKEGQYRTFEELIGEKVRDFEVEGDMLYIMGEDSVYSMSLIGKLPEKAKKVMDLPSYDNYGGFCIFKGKPVFRGHDYTDDESTLYWNGVEVCDEGVYSVTASGKYLYYITLEDGELYRFDGKKSEPVIEDVHDFAIVNDKAYCIADYSDEKESGDLYNVTGKKPVKVAEDVERVSTVSEAVKGETNYLWG